MSIPLSKEKRKSIKMAIDLVQKGELSIREASEAFGVPKSTIHRHMSSSGPPATCGGASKNSPPEKVDPIKEAISHIKKAKRILLDNLTRQQLETISLVLIGSGTLSALIDHLEEYY